MIVLTGRQALPLHLTPDAVFAHDGESVINASAFRASVELLAKGLPRNGEIANLCGNRYRFIRAFAATLLRGQTTLLPASHAPSAVAEMMAAYPACSVVDDSTDSVNGSTDLPGDPDPDADFIAAIGHTSGSTGRPAAHQKLWSEFRATTAFNAAAIRAALRGSAATEQPWIVATVPPQHMYGLETSVLLPLLAGFGIHSGRPLLPADVAVALGDSPAPRVLVSTPIHLRALVQSEVDFPDVALVVSATAPLEHDAARRIEARFSAPLLEMFGSTETCVIATRHTAKKTHWRPYPGIGLEPSISGTIVRAPWLARAQLLQDFLELHDEGSFAVIGRHSDLVEVAGKRASLMDLTRRIASLPGVKDAYVFRPSAKNRAGVPRCAALVVAPGFSAQEILRRLRSELDAVFLPRPLVVVKELPRNEVGKLPVELAQELLSGASRHGNRAHLNHLTTAALQTRRGK